MKNYALSILNKIKSSNRLFVVGITCGVALLLTLGVVAISTSLTSSNQSMEASSSPDHSKTSRASKNGQVESSSTNQASTTDTTASSNATNTSQTSGSSSRVLPTPSIIKMITNSDGSVVKQIVTYQSIPFTTISHTDANLLRGVSKIVQTGKNGVQTITYAVTYDKNGNEISRKTLSETTTSQPVNQIVNTGTSDFNLNTTTVNGTSFGEACTPSDYNTQGDGCIGTPSDSYIGIVTINGQRYVRCVSESMGICNITTNVSPIIPIGSNNLYSYNGMTYRADERAGGGLDLPLTAALCSEYGLNCSSW